MLERPLRLVVSTNFVADCSFQLTLIVSAHTQLLSTDSFLVLLEKIKNGCNSLYRTNLPYAGHAGVNLMKLLHV